MSREDAIIGYVTIRIPVIGYIEQEPPVGGERYEVIEPLLAELVSHSMPERWHQNLVESLTDQGITLGPWRDDELVNRQEPTPLMPEDETTTESHEVGSQVGWTTDSWAKGFRYPAP